MDPEVVNLRRRSATRYGAFVAALILTGSTSIEPVDAQEIIFLIRHAERDFSSTDGGLVEAGRDRALAWAGVFADVDLDAIITSEMRRTRPTAAPISDSLDIPPRVFTRYDVEGLVDLLRTEYADDRVLLVGHSSSIPQIIRALGSDEWISISDYNDLFIVDLDEDGSVSVVQLNVN